MNRVDQNINEDMIDDDLIDVESMDFLDGQTWLCTVENYSGNKVDIAETYKSFVWPVTIDAEYLEEEKRLYELLDSISKEEALNLDKHKFDSRTFVRPRKHVQRPSLHTVVDPINPSPKLTVPGSGNPTNKYLTYNKYNTPSPMLRLKTFDIDANTHNSTAVKQYALKRRSLVQEDDQQLEDVDASLVSNNSERLSSENLPSKPINIDLSQPVHNFHSPFNRGLPSMLNDRNSLMRMSPPSLVSSMNMDNSGNFNMESLESKKSIVLHKDAGMLTSGRESILLGRESLLAGRESIDPMMTSMTLSILDDKDMTTSFLSQTTYHDNESLIGSLPHSLVSSVNSSFNVPNTKSKHNTESNVFSSATFTHLEQSERLLSARPRCNMFNSFTIKDSSLKSSDSYTKSRDETCQANVPGQKISPEMSETVTLHYSNVKFKKDDAEKENINASFEKDDAFYKDMGMQKIDSGKNSLNLTWDKHEMNEIVQARQKLSLARATLPNEERVVLPNEVDNPVQTIQLLNQIITVPKHSMEHASELLSRRRALNGVDKEVATPKRNATFKKLSPKTNCMDTTVVYVKPEENIIDINSATLCLIDSREKELNKQEWSSNDRAMVGSNESTDTATFSSSSPPESAPESNNVLNRLSQVSSTPLAALKKGANELLNLHNTISPIYDTLNDNSYTVSRENERAYDHNMTGINNATMVKKHVVKRDILANKTLEKKGEPVVRSLPTNQGVSGLMVPPQLPVPRKTTHLPTSKLRQYSSHKELNRIPASTTIPSRLSYQGRGGMVRKGVYSSNPVLSPPEGVPPTLKNDSYTVMKIEKEGDYKSNNQIAPTPVLVRQGTETLRRERPQSQLVTPKDTPQRPCSAAGAPQQRVNRPSTVPLIKPTAIVTTVDRPSTGDTRISALPRPSRLPAPRRSIRPPSVYSVAPTGDNDHY